MVGHIKPMPTSRKLSKRERNFLRPSPLPDAQPVSDILATKFPLFEELLGFSTEEILQNPEAFLNAIRPQHTSVDLEELTRYLSEFRPEDFVKTVAVAISEMRALTTTLIYRAFSSDQGQASGADLLKTFDNHQKKPDLHALQRAALDYTIGERSLEERDFIKSSLAQVEAAWQSERSYILFLKDRLDNKPDSTSTPNTVERLERLTAHARQHGDDGLEALARLTFPEWSVFRTTLAAPSNEAALPSEAPEKYQGLRGPETPPAFVQRVYGEWLGHGLTRAHIRKLDPKLYEGISNWLSRPGNEWPADVDLPTLKEQNDRLVDHMTAGKPDVRTLKDARRIEGAITRRLRAREE